MSTLSSPPDGSLYEDLLATLRVAAMLARHQHHPEQSPQAWLEMFIRCMQRFGWDTADQYRTEHLYTPAPGLWVDALNGQLPPAQAPNTRFRTLVRHVISTKADGSKPLPPSVSDGDNFAHLRTELQLPTSGRPRFRLVQLAGTPDPKAPKTRLPLAKTHWEATFNHERFEAQRARFEANLLKPEHILNDW
jgi:hypothetical protein